MKMLRRQEGYTLLLVLVLVVLLLMVTASFTVASMNQQKQVVKTDNSFTATSLAEMGTEITKKNLAKLIESEETLYNSCIKSNSSNQSSCLTTSKNRIIASLNSSAKTYKVDGDTKTYTLSSVIQKEKANEFAIIITGKSNDSNKKITLNFQIKPEVISSDKIKDSTQNPVLVSGQTIVDQSIIDCLKNAACKAKIEQQKVKTYENIFDDKSNNFDPIAETTYIFQSGANFGHLKNDDIAENVKFFTPSDKVINFTKFFQLKSSTVEGGRVILSHNGSSSNQYMFRDTTLIANSLSITGNNVVIGIDGDSKICIKGSDDSFLNDIVTSNTVNIYFLIPNSSQESTYRHTFQLGNKHSPIITGATIHKKRSTNFNNSCTVNKLAFPEVTIPTENSITEIKYN